MGVFHRVKMPYAQVGLVTLTLVLTNGNYNGFGNLTLCHTACVNKCSEEKSQRRSFKYKSDPKGFDKS